MMPGERLKLDADALREGPADRCLLNQERDLISRDIQQEIHFHACDDIESVFKPATFVREVQ